MLPNEGEGCGVIHMYEFYEIDNDGRGSNPWELTIDGKYAGTFPDHWAVLDAVAEAQAEGHRIVMHSAEEWHQREAARS